MVGNLIGCFPVFYCEWMAYRFLAYHIAFKLTFKMVSYRLDTRLYLQLFWRDELLSTLGYDDGLDI